MDEKGAVKLLESNNHTLVIYGEDRVITSDKRGVLPLVELIDSGEDLSGFSAVDKVVGKAAAFLYVILGIKKLYAFVVSDSALTLLRENGVELRYDTLTARIKNRTGTGYCPMETAVLGDDDAKTALMHIRNTQKALTK